MKFPVIRKSYVTNIIILIPSVIISWFTLLMGLAHLFEGKHPKVPYGQHLMGVAICIVLCIIGIIFLVIAIASIKGILFKLKNDH